jgi:SAM-dependent methyltransferase
MRKLALRNCPICEEIYCEVLHTQKFVLPEGHPLASGYDVVCCEHCGFVYANTVATQKDCECFYAKFSKYEDDKTSSGGGDTPWDAKRFEDTALHIGRFLPDTQSRILDIGCANGGLLKTLRKSGFENLCGIDPSPVCVANTQSSGIEAHTGSLFQIPDGLGRFDFIILSHVLEHIRDLKVAIQAIGGLMRGGGIYIEVPDAARYVDFLFSPFQDFNTEHINHFSRVNLENLMQLSGFLVKQQGAKLIESAPNMPYPALWSISCEATDRPSSGFTPEKDDLLVESIKRYILKSDRLMYDIESKIRSVLTKYPQVIVWGTGQLAMKLLAETSLANAQIVAFVDGNPINQGKVLCGTRILAPDQIGAMQFPIIVTSILHGQEIKKMIKHQYQLPNKIILL